MTLIEINGPATEPVTADEVKAAARIDSDITEFDTQIAIIIPALRRQAEARTGRVLVTQTLELVLDSFPTGEIDLLLPNVQSIGSVKYRAVGTGTENILSSSAYSLDDSSTPSWLIQATGTTWPETYASANSVRIRFDVGYGDANKVPQDIKLWMLAHATQILRSPDGIIGRDLQPMPFVDGLLDFYRVVRAA